MVRPCCDKPNVKKGFCSPEEDAKILEHGKGNWTSFPKRAGVRRCGKSCRLRWTNHLRPDLQDESFTPQEEELIIKLHATIGSRWALIAQQLPGKTDNDVKNYWNTKLRKKLSGMGIDPVTHKPFSQILADYGNIGGLPKTGMRIGSLNKDLKNAIFMKREALISAPTISKPQLTILSPTNNMVSPKTEPNQDNFLNHNKSSSLDLLAQLQAIKLVTETSNYTQPSSYKESTFSFSLSSSSSPSSSSSTDSSAVQETMSPAPAFNWNDFLLEDAFLPPSHGAQEDHDHEKAAQDFSYQKVEGPNNKDSEVNETSSCESSFVEALLARENEMLLDFPQLLEEGFY